MSIRITQETSRLRLSGVHKRLGATAAVDGVDFALEPAEAVGLVGPNGAGKTTLLHLCAGLLAPDAGSLALGAQGNPQRSNARRLLGFAPQATAVYDDLTVEENLTFFARVQGLSGDVLHGAVAYGLSLSGLGERRHARAVTLSGGMRRRLHVASALLHRPTVVLLDEPTVGVDAESRKHILAAVELVRRAGAAVLYASHHLDEVAQLCQRVLILANGKIAEELVRPPLSALESVLTSRSGT